MPLVWVIVESAAIYTSGFSLILHAGFECSSSLH
jgi:hypothetical protein